MSRRANPTVVGAFVLGALALAVAALIVFGSGRFFQTKYRFVLFFEESLDGLNVGSPVTFRGISVGSVSRILMRYDEEGNVQTPVYVDLVQGRIEGELPEIDDPDEIIAHFIKRGMRAELRSQSFVTGQLSVALVIREEVPIRLEGSDPRYDEIPTARSPFAEFTESLERVRLDQVILNLNQVLEDVRQVVDTLPLAATLDSLQGAVSDIRRLVRDFDDRSGEITASADETLAAFRRAADRTEPVMANADALLESARRREEPIAYQLLATLDELAGAARALRVLADYVERNPSAFIFGKGTREDAEAKDQ